MEFSIPAPLTNMKSFMPGLSGHERTWNTNKPAKAVAALLHPDFIKEEEHALPPLALLSVPAKGALTAQMRGALAMTERLKSEFPRMLTEHRRIVAALGKPAGMRQKAKQAAVCAFHR